MYKLESGKCVYIYDQYKGGVVFYVLVLFMLLNLIFMVDKFYFMYLEYYFKEK